MFNLFNSPERITVTATYACEIMTCGYLLAKANGKDAITDKSNGKYYLTGLVRNGGRQGFINECIRVFGARDVKVFGELIIIRHKK